MAVILAADIGGTNCRLGLFRLAKTRLTMEKAAWVETGSIASETALVAAMERELGVSPDDADVIVAAIAGPVEGCVSGVLSNGQLVLNFTELNAKERRYFLINDFMAQAYAVLSPEGEKARKLAGPQKPAHDSVRAVIGAGTGLGQATLVKLEEGRNSEPANWIAVTSENGHSAFPFVNGAENDFHTYLRTKLKIPYATGDETVSGRGLAALHEFLTGEKLTPAQVGGQALSEDTPTLKWYSRFYARVVRNWMLCTMCEGGIWIAGGIAAQNPLVVTCDYFLQELNNAPYRSPRWDSYIRNMPVYLMEDTNCGLWGAARFGQQECGALDAEEGRKSGSAKDGKEGKEGGESRSSRNGKEAKEPKEGGGKDGKASEGAGREGKASDGAGEGKEAKAAKAK